MTITWAEAGRVALASLTLRRSMSHSCWVSESGVVVLRVTVMMAMSSKDWEVTVPTSLILRMVSSSGRVTSSSVS